MVFWWGEERMAEKGGERVDWVDIAKGICIIMVVMFHSVLGVEVETGTVGWMHTIIAFARPFRMPDFFLISGLFLGLVIDRSWRRFLDRRVVHFVYFYILWLTIQFLFKAPAIAMDEGVPAAIGSYFFAYVEPFGTLWFIYMLPIFFVFTRFVRTLPVWFVFAWAALLEMLPFHVGWTIPDEFAARYVYLFAGYAFSGWVFAFVRWLREHPVNVMIALAVWAPLNALAVFTPAPDSLVFMLQPSPGASGQTGGWSELPVISLVLGLSGALAVVGAASLLARLKTMRWLEWLGAHSIVVYLAFFLPMAATRIFFLKTGLIADVGNISLLTNIAGIAGPIVLYGIVQWTGKGKFLFERPAWARIDPPKVRHKEAVIPAE
jgi:uncharacterized membrane protein YcfT